MSKKHRGQFEGEPHTYALPSPAGGIRLETFVPWRLVKRGCRKQIITPLNAPRAFTSETPPGKTPQDSPLIRALGLAHYWQRLLDEERVTVSYDHALTLNDLFYASFNQDLGGGYSGNRGSDGHTVHYEIPYGYWLLGVTAGSHDYHQTVAGASQSYVYSGKSKTAEIQLTRLIYRDTARKSNIYLQGWKRDNSSYIDDTEILVQRREMAGWEAGITHREFIGNATLDASLAYRRGTGALGAIPAPEEEFGTGTSRPKIIKANAQISIPFQIGEQNLRYQGSWRAQWNRTPLVSQDHFSIGGRFTVRGFDGEMTLAAERGWLIRNDLGIILAGQEVYLGVDYGSVGGLCRRLLQPPSGRY